MLSSVSRSLGSVIFPVNAAAAAVSGYKYILSSNVPERPEGHSSKADGVRGRSLSHAYASHTTRLMKASTAAIKGLPISIRFSNTWEDGLTSKKGNRVSFIISETIQKSRNPGFAEEPKTTWFNHPLL
jgi:hypothetical protein